MDIGHQFTGIIGKHLLTETDELVNNALDKYDAMYGSPSDYENPKDYKGDEEVNRHINDAVFHNMSSHVAHHQLNHDQSWLSLNKMGFALHKAAGRMMNWDRPWLGDPNPEVIAVATEIHKAGTKAVDSAQQYRDLVEKGIPKEKG